MIIKRNVNVLIPNDKVIRKLKIQKNQNIIYEEVNGVITFIGTKKESDEICWHDLYTGHKTKDKMNVVRIQSARDKEIRHLCNYMYVEDVLYSDVILLNVDKIKILSSNFDVMMFIITQKAGVEAIDKYYNPECEYDNYPMFSRMRIRIESNKNSAYYEEFAEDLEIRRRDNIGAFKDKGFYAFCPKQKLLIANGNCKIGAKELLNKLQIFIQGKNTEEYVVDISDAVSFCDSKGYMYIESFEVQERFEKIKLNIIANRKVDVEVFNEETQKWENLDDINKVKKNSNIRLRLLVRYGDCINSIYISKE